MPLDHLWEKTHDELVQHCALLEMCLHEFVSESGVVFTDPRLDYVELQVDAGALERGRKVLGITD